MKKVVITGLSGVIGGIIAKELSPRMQVVDVFHKKKYFGKARIQGHVQLDLLNKNKIQDTFEKINPDVVVHMAAVTHIDRCEMDKKYGKKGSVWKINVEGSGEIAKFCAKYKVPLVFLSTECVFDGKKDFFSENARKNPINWYGFTKSEAENLLLSSGAPITIVRSVVAYHKNDAGKTIYGQLLEKLKSKEFFPVVSDQLFTPTYTYDIVRAVKCVIEDKLTGVFHVAPKKALSPCDFALLIAKRNKYSPAFIKETTLNSYLGQDKAALRLRHACLSGHRSNLLLKFVPSDPEDVL